VGQGAACREGWTDRQALFFYLAIQAAVVFTLVRRIKPARGSWRQLFKLGSWTLPLFALPAYC
jgi:hypothetical protein